MLASRHEGTGDDRNQTAIEPRTDLNCMGRRGFASAMTPAACAVSRNTWSMAPEINKASRGPPFSLRKAAIKLKPSTSSRAGCSLRSLHPIDQGSAEKDVSPLQPSPQQRSCVPSCAAGFPAHHELQGYLQSRECCVNGELPSQHQRHRQRRDCFGWGAPLQLNPEHASVPQF